MNKITKHILITGGAGLLGSYLLKTLLEDSGNLVYLIVKPKVGQTPRNRIKRLLGDFFKIPDSLASKRLVVFGGNIELDFLGLKVDDYRFLTTKINTIFHAAALTSLLSSLKILRHSNLLGTKNIVKFAQRCTKLSTFNYISSVFVCGKYDGKFSEFDFDVQQSFNNYYEQSKFEGEKFVRNNQNDTYDSLIFRPSAIMGAFVDGRTTRFSNLYVPLHFFSRGTFEKIPIEKHASQNIVPVDWVSNAICSLSKTEKGNKTFHLVNPLRYSCLKYFKFGEKYFGYKNPKFVEIKNFDFNRLTQSQRLILRPLAGYFNLKTEIISNFTQKFLKRQNLLCPFLDRKYFERVFDYCHTASFIRKK